jgi:hypothetical protein
MPQMGYDTKTDRLTDCQSQCDSDSELAASHARPATVRANFHRHINQKFSCPFQGHRSCSDIVIGSVLRPFSGPSLVQWHYSDRTGRAALFRAITPAVTLKYTDSRSDNTAIGLALVTLPHYLFYISQCPLHFSKGALNEVNEMFILYRL